MRTYTVVCLDIGGSLHVAAVVDSDGNVLPSKQYVNAATIPWSWQGPAMSAGRAVDEARAAFAHWHHTEGPIGATGVVVGGTTLPGVSTYDTRTSEPQTVTRRWWDPRRYW